MPRKITVTLVAAALGLLGSAFAITNGDINGDGFTNPTDTQLLADYLLGRVDLTAPQKLAADINGDASIDAADLTFLSGAASIKETSPANGESGVGVRRETIVRFSGPVDPSDLTANAIYATYLGNKLPARVQVSPDNTTVTLFYANPLPASMVVRVTVEGDAIRSANGLPVDADNDGAVGGTATIDFTTLSLTQYPNTVACGRVFASEFENTKGTPLNIPLEGVKITVDGREDTLFTYTDAQGNYRLDPAPAGRFFVHVDGRTVTSALIGGVATPTSFPGGPYYPFVGKPMAAQPGEETNQPDIFLPLIAENTLTPVSDAHDTVIGFPGEVIAEHPEFSAVNITVPASSLYSDDGTIGGKVGIAPVPPDRIPGHLPEGVNFPLVITVQTDGPTNFDEPVPACFPNLPDPDTGEILPPGAKTALWSFNHDIGDWEIIGTMTISDDGTLACTNADVGIRAPGWHGVFPGAGGGGGPGPGGGGGDCKDTGGCSTACGGPPDPCCGSDDPCCGQPPELCCKEKGFNECCDHDTTPPHINPVGPLSYDCTVEDEYPSPQAEAFDDCDGYLGVVDGAPEGLEIDTTRPGIYNYTFSVSDSKGNVATKTFPFTVWPCPHCDGWEAALCAGAVPGTLGLCVGSVLECATIIGCLPGIASCGAGIAGVGHCAESGCYDWLNKKVSVPEEELYYILKSLEPFITSIMTIEDEAKGNPTLAQEAEIRELAQDALSLVGADAGDRIHALLVEIERRKSDPEVSRKQVDTPSYFLATIPKAGAFRGKTNQSGRFSLRMPGLLEYGAVISLYNFESNFTASTFIADIIPGQTGIEFPPYVWETDVNARDSDSDSLSDYAESIMGTDIYSDDTDGDGRDDYSELLQGTNPSDGIAVLTGIIASTATLGPAVDVSASNELIATACGNAGVSIFNIYSGEDATIIGQVDTPGYATAVACAPGRVAVADGTNGLVIVDVTDPPASDILYTVPIAQLGGGSAQAVVALGDLAVVGTTSGYISRVDMRDGTLLEGANLGSSIEDMALQGGRLYVLTSTQLIVSPFLNGPLGISGAVAFSNNGPSGHGRNGLAVLGNVAYAVDRLGYDTINISNPAAPQAIATGATLQRGWSNLAVTASGRALVAMGVNVGLDNTHDLHVYDISDSSNTDNLLISFSNPDPNLDPVPGAARDVALYNGLGYAALDSAGLAVVNFLDPDTGQVPPSGSLSSNALGGFVTEGAQFLVTANVSDDVQVRNVAFSVNGTKVSTDGNAPYELLYRTPALAEGGLVTVTAIARDTGGNTRELGPLELSVISDTVPPSVTIDPNFSTTPAILDDSFTIDVAVYDNVGVDLIRFYIDGVEVVAVRTAAGQWRILNPPSLQGPHLLRIEVYDVNGNVFVSEETPFNILGRAVSRVISVGFDETSDAVSRPISVVQLDEIPEDAVSRVISVGFDERDDPVSRVFSVNFAP